MWWRRAVAIVGFSVLTAGCGFEPIAAPTSTTTADARLRLSSVDIVVTDSGESQRFEYLVRQQLRRSIANDPSAPDRLTLAIDIDREGLAIQQNDTVTRFNLTATVDYSVVAENQTEVLAGKTISITALNATASQFSTSVSERDAMNRLASDIATRLVTLLRVHYSSAALSQ